MCVMRAIRRSAMQAACRLTGGHQFSAVRPVPGVMESVCIRQCGKVIRVPLDDLKPASVRYANADPAKFRLRQLWIVGRRKRS